MNIEPIYWGETIYFSTRQIKYAINLVSNLEMSKLPVNGKNLTHLRNSVRYGWTFVSLHVFYENMRTNVPYHRVNSETAEKIIHSALTKTTAKNQAKKLKKLLAEAAYHPVSFYQIVSETEVFKLLHPKAQSYLRYLSDKETANQAAIVARANHYEQKLVEYVQSLTPINFKTEEEIRANDPNAKFTPDILFDRFVTIIVNGERYRVNWIDAKSMIGTRHVTFQKYSLLKQAKKYYHEFGYGAICFQFGLDSTILNFSALKQYAVCLTYSPEETHPLWTEDS